MPESNIKLMVEKDHQRGQFYTLWLDKKEADSFWEWKRRNYKKKPGQT